MIKLFRFFTTALLFLSTVFVLRYLFLAWQYQKFLLKKYPTEEPNLTVWTINGFQALHNLFKKVDLEDEDVELLELRNKVRNSYIFVASCGLLYFLATI